ncbi:phage tail protein [Flavobacterium sp.]|jgi:hypothetical protein|uniref:phage tail protein n=1 Tax=Flavobacterium sp. TaxID=239 RepID=UPI0037C05BFA
MATLALGLAGAAVGSFFGMPALGWAVGSMLGAALFPTKGPTTEGPRLSDLQVQTSTYGTVIPQVYGSARIAGNIIWSTNKKETRHEETQGGKGGPTATSVTYTYAIDLAVAICEGPITGIRRIWANSILIYDASSTGSAGSIISSKGFFAGSSSNYGSLEVYNGSEDQLPNATIQSQMQPGADTPAYRGTAYVVFSNLQLADFGNNVPQLEFEIVNTDQAQIIDGRVLSTTNSFLIDEGNFTNGYQSYCGITDLNEGSIRLIVGGTNTPNSTTVGAPAYTKILNTDLTNSTTESVDSTDSWMNIHTNYPNNTFLRLGAPVNDKTVFFNYGNYPMSTTSRNLQFFPKNSSPSTNLGLYDNGYVFDYWFGDEIAAGDSRCQGVCPVQGYSSFFVLFQRTSENAICSRYYICNESGIKSRGVCNYGPSVQPLTSVSPSLAIPKANGTVNCAMVDISETQMISGNRLFNIGGGLITFYKYISHPGQTIQSVYCKNKVYAIYGTDTIAGKQRVTIYSPDQFISNDVDKSSISLPAVINRIAAQGGIPETDLDTSQLIDEKVVGYVVNAQNSIRAMLEPLMQAHFFDAVESDTKIKFVKRGNDAAGWIYEEDLAAFEGSVGFELPNDVSITRTQEVELPQEITIQYLSWERAYQESAQYSRRETTSSNNKVSQSLPMVLTSQRAKQIADVLLQEAWKARQIYKFSTPRRYAIYEPTDVVYLQRNGTVYTLRLIKKTEGQNGVIDWEAVEEDASIYNQNAPASPGIIIDPNVLTPQPTVLRMLDIPILRDYDNNFGMYCAAAPTDSNWPGAGLYKSIDDISYTAQTSIYFNKETPCGYVRNVPDYWNPMDNRFDEINFFIVEMGNGELSSMTEDQVLNGGNTCVIGNEVLQFKTAELIDVDTYRLTGLLRGRKGTDWAIDTHQANEEFTLLNPNTVLRYEEDRSRMNVSTKYKAVTSGQYIGSAYPKTVTNTGRSLKPYSVIYAKGTKNGNTDILITWIRRTRLSGEWQTPEVPLGENFEKYEIEIYGDASYNTIKRTEVALTTNWTYSTAQQNLDFGTTQNILYVRIYQISDLVGRGFVCQATLNII